MLVLYLIHTGPCLPLASRPGMGTFCVSFWERQSFSFFSCTMDRVDLGRQASCSSPAVSLRGGYPNPLEQWTLWEPSRPWVAPHLSGKGGLILERKFAFCQVPISLLVISDLSTQHIWATLASLSPLYNQSLLYSLFCHWFLLTLSWEPAIGHMLLHLLQDHFWVHCSLQHSVLCWNPYVRPFF